MKAIFLAALFLCITSFAAEARRGYVTLAPECGVSMPCEGGSYSAKAKRFLDSPFGVPLQQYHPQRASAQAVPTQVVGGRPAGCPHAFCGCGASLYLFGRIIPSLNLAANWLKFPRTSPAPKMVAARRGHVMVLESHVSGDVWIVHDSNSGRHLTRLHARSIAGYVVVNPNG